MKFFFLVVACFLFQSNSFATTQLDVDTLNAAGCKVTGMSDNIPFEAITATLSNIEEQSAIYWGPNFKLGALLMPEKFVLLGNTESRIIRLYVASEGNEKLVKLGPIYFVSGPGFPKEVELSFRVNGKFTSINFSCN